MARVQHMVLVKFKPEVTTTRIGELFQLVRSMRRTIPGIEYCDGGPYSSTEGLDRGFTHGFLVTFRDARARDAYLPHPEHAKVRDALLEVIESVIAFDFEESPAE